MKPLLALIAAFIAILLASCSTPGEVKEALGSLDEAYASNGKVMKQYRTLVQQINERANYWYAYTTQRGLLNSALKWATTPGTPKTATLEAAFMGTKLQTAVNQVRLEGLPEVRGDNGKLIFTKGTSNIDNLVQQLPRLANLATDRSADKFIELTGISHDTYKGFDEYQTNVAALRRINGAVKRYLDIDVTVKPDDVKEISSAIKQLQN